MPIALRRLPLDLVVAALVAAALVAATLRAGSYSPLSERMASGRWMVYLLLALAALAAALRHRAAPPVLPAMLWATLLALAGASAAWSTHPRFTLSSAAALALVTLPAVLLAGVVRADPRYAGRIAAGVAGGGALVAAGGLVLLLFDRNLALYAPGAPDISHLRGLGGNPNTVPLLLAISVPPTLWFATANRLPVRVAAAVAWLASAATIVASGSRGSALGAAVGTVALALLLRRPGRVRIAVAASALALLATDAAVQQVRNPSLLPAATATQLVAAPLAPPPTRPGYPGRLGDELGHGTASRLGSGRLRAWRGALEQTAARPLGGYGFATEPNVFVDRFAQFQGVFVESSYVGIVLQLGVAGGLLLLVLLSVLARCAVRARGTEAAAALAAGAVGGAVVGTFQSYLLFAGSVGAAAFWLCAFGAAALATPPAPRRRRAAALAAGLVLAVLLVTPEAMREAHADTRAEQRGIQSVQRAAGAIDGPRLSAFRITFSLDCLLYAEGDNVYALELCWDDARLVEAIDRRGERSPRFWSLRFQQQDAPSRIEPARLEALLERIGALDYANRFAEGYPPRQSTADTGPVVIEDWLRLSRRARGAASGSA